MCNDDCNQGRSCDSLGVCQRRQPPCAGCTVPPSVLAAPLTLAPGVLEAYRVPIFGTAQQRRELVRWVKWGAVFGAVVAEASLLAGVRSGLLP